MQHAMSIIIMLPRPRGLLRVYAWSTMIPLGTALASSIEVSSPRCRRKV